MTEHWLVLGGSSAIARAFVRAVSAQGAAVTVAGRDLDDLEATAADARLRGAASARVLACDATDATSRAACVAAAPVPGLRLNVMLAVGLMPEQSAMDQHPHVLAQMIESTYAGPLHLLQGLAPAFEQQRGGRIIVIGSVAGDRGRRKNFLYGSAKAGLAVYTEGLRARLFACGATVTLVKPGFVDTAMTWGLPGLFLVASPEACAASMLRASTRGQSTLYTPAFWTAIMWIIRCIPAKIMKRLNI